MTAERSSLRRALARDGFRRLFAAQTVSRWGDTFNSVALVILVYRLTGSGAKVAGTVVFEIAPVVLFGFVAGAVVDRRSRRGVMLVADLGRAGLALLLVFFHDELAVVYLVAFGLSGFSVFFNPAAASVLPALVPDDEVLGANSAIWSAAVISQIALAPAAGALVGVAGPGPAFAINAATFLASAAFIARLPTPRGLAVSPSKHLSDVLEGLHAIRASRFLTVLAGVQGLAALSAGATSALLVVLAERHLGVGAGRFGLLIAAIGVGAGFGPLVLQRLVGDVRRPRLLYGPYLLRGGVDLVLAVASSFGVALGALTLYGVGTSTGNVTYNAVLQTTVPDRLRGRVFAFYDVVWQTARLVSIGFGGVLADRIGITAVYWSGGALLLAAGALGLLAGRHVPGLDSARVCSVEVAATPTNGDSPVSSSEGVDGTDARASFTGDISDTGVFQAVLDGYDAVYDALPHSETFNRLWRTKAYGGDFPDEFAHIGFLTVAEAQRMRELLHIGAEHVLVDLACGTGGPGLWMMKQSGASMIGVDPSAAGLSAARTRARDVGLAERARFEQGTFEQTNLPDGVTDAVMSVDALQYAPDKRAAVAECFRILRPGGRVAFIAFEVEPAKVEGFPVMSVDPISNYAPLLTAAGFHVDAYEETPGWQERVNAAFGSILGASDALVAEMGERAAAGVIAEAMFTMQVQPYPRRVLAAARRPG